MPRQINGTTNSISVTKWSLSKGSSDAGGDDGSKRRNEIIQSEGEFLTVMLPVTPVTVVVAISSTMDTRLVNPVPKSERFQNRTKKTVEGQIRLRH